MAGAGAETRSGSRSAPWWRIGAGAAAVAMLLAGCSSSSAADGWVSVGTGDTYGEWELFAEVRDGEWTGCLRFPDDDAPKQCGDPGARRVLFVEDSDGAQYGAIRDGVELEFADTGEDVETMDLDGVGDHRFFVVADTPVRVRR